MVLVQNFSAKSQPAGENRASALEKNLAAIADRVKEQSGTLPEDTPLDRSTVKEALRTWDVSAPPGVDEDESGSAGAAAGHKPDPSLLPKYLADGANPEAAHEVSILLDLAIHGDVRKALRVARKRTPFVEDAFHDALVDNVLPQMRQRGLI